RVPVRHPPRPPRQGEALFGSRGAAGLGRRTENPHRLPVRRRRRRAGADRGGRSGRRGHPAGVPVGRVLDLPI
ncbi:MAG: hypothetical protein AVDCRST_MAG73-2669, partial [uncultured Thermomicrobiales bacterium]